MRCSTAWDAATRSCSPFDQHAQPAGRHRRSTSSARPAWTFKSLAIIALATGAPVVPATSWREADGRHVLRFEAPHRRRSSMPSTTEAIRLHHPRLQRRRWSASCCAGPSSGTGCTGAGRRWPSARAPQARPARAPERHAMNCPLRRRASTRSSRGRRRSSTATSRGRCSSTSAAASGTSSTPADRPLHGRWRRTTRSCTAFSAVPNKPYIDVAPLPATCSRCARTGRSSATRRCKLFDEGHIRAAAGYNDLGFNSFFRRGWKRFYLKWYDAPLRVGTCAVSADGGAGAVDSHDQRRDVRDAAGGRRPRPPPRSVRRIAALSPRARHAQQRRAARSSSTASRTPGATARR